eukprot:jgi/Astpho2/3515/Aster-06429
MGFSFSYTTNSVSDEDAFRASELGVTLIDTADIYGQGKNEELVGKAIKGKRDKFIIATKFGNVNRDGKMQVDGSPQHVRAACEASLARLGIDQIDLYYQHRVDRTLPIEETWKELKNLVHEGKVKYLGISEASPEEIRKAHAIHPITACQLEWSLWTRDAEESIIPTCRELGIGIVAYSPLGRGMLTGAIKSAADLHESDGRAVRMPRFQGENFDKNYALVKEVQLLASKKGVTSGQLALAWVHSQGDDVFPIPGKANALHGFGSGSEGSEVGTKREKYLTENVKAFHVKLTSEDKAALEAIFHQDKVAGERYDPNMMKHGWRSGVTASSA